MITCFREWPMRPGGGPAPGSFDAECPHLDAHVLVPVNEHIDDAGMEAVVRALGGL